MAGARLYQSRITPEGTRLQRTPAVLDEGFHLSNGLGLSPDERTLYFADSATRQIWAYEYAIRRGAAGNRRIFVQVPSSEGIPDGLAVDAEGFVWSAQWYGGCVVRYDPDGKEELRILIPAKQTSSVTFGGPELTELYITTVAATRHFGAAGRRATRHWPPATEIEPAA